MLHFKMLGILHLLYFTLIMFLLHERVCRFMMSDMKKNMNTTEEIVYTR